MDQCLASPVDRAEIKKICDTIISTVESVTGEDATAGGCRAFYTPQEWIERGEVYGCNSTLIVVHDGGDLAPFFDFDRGRYSLCEQMRKALHKIGYMAEACTCWYTAVYPME